MTYKEYYDERIAGLIDPSAPAHCSFNNHKATQQKLSDDITVINWQNKNGSNAYQVRYVFDFDKLYISGDLGNAMFQWYGTRINPFFHIISDWVYLQQKMQCTSEHDVIDRKLFEHELTEWKDSYSEDVCDIDDCVVEIENAYDIGKNDAKEYADLIWANKVITDFCDDGEEVNTIANFGRVLPYRFLCWFEGLRLACKQLREEQ
jgi:hypothetical protein